MLGQGREAPHVIGMERCLCSRCRGQIPSMRCSHAEPWWLWYHIYPELFCIKWDWKLTCQWDEISEAMTVSPSGMLKVRRIKTESDRHGLRTTLREMLNLAPFFEEKCRIIIYGDEKSERPKKKWLFLFAYRKNILMACMYVSKIPFSRGYYLHRRPVGIANISVYCWMCQSAYLRRTSLKGYAEYQGLFENRWKSNISIPMLCWCGGVQISRE